MLAQTTEQIYSPRVRVATGLKIKRIKLRLKKSKPLRCGKLHPRKLQAANLYSNKVEACNSVETD